MQTRRHSLGVAFRWHVFWVSPGVSQALALVHTWGPHGPSCHRMASGPMARVEASPPAAGPTELGEVPGGCECTQGQLLLLSRGASPLVQGVGTDKGRVTITRAAHRSLGCAGRSGWAQAPSEGAALPESSPHLGTARAGHLDPETAWSCALRAPNHLCTVCLVKPE